MHYKFTQMKKRKQKISPEQNLEELAQQKDSNLIKELISFLMENKKWWLTPIVLAIILLGVLVVIGGSGAAPFIYSLF